MEIKVQEQTASAPAKTEPVTLDVQKAVEEAEIRGKIEAEGKFIEELIQNAEENEEKTGSNRTEEPEETRSQRDTAALSDESRYYKLSPDELSDLAKGDEEAELAWKEIENWRPTGAKPVTDELSQLSALYEKLLQMILSNTMAEVREGQLAALDQVLSDILLKLLNTRIGELNSFLNDFGTGDSVIALKAALYRSVTGKSPNHQELELVFKETFRSAEGQGTNSGSGRGGNIHVPVYDSESGQKQGIIYQPAADGRIKNNSRYAARMHNEAAITDRGGKTTKASASAKAYGAEASITAAGKKEVYAPRDLELAERFAGYMNHAGNLFERAELAGKSEELYGFLAAVMSIKAQTYAAFSGMDKSVFSDLREAVDKMMDYYIQKAFRQSEEIYHARTGPHYRVFEPKAAYKIYYYIMNLYQTSGNLRETADKGIRRAYQQYLKDKDSLGGEEDSGSFFTKEKTDAIEDWKEGKRVLERDWKEFLDFLDWQGSGGISPGVMELSPWGMFLEPGTHSESKVTANPLFMLGTIGAILLLIFFIGYMGA